MSNLKDILNPTPAGSSTFVASGTLPNGKPIVLKADGTVEVVNKDLPTSIPAGSSVEYSNVGQVQYNVVAFDPNNVSQFIIVYRASSGGGGEAALGTISGTSVTFGTPVVFEANGTNMTVAFDPNTTGKFVISYKDISTNYGKAIVGTIAGTSITFGTAVVFLSNYTIDPKIDFDPNTAGKFVIAFRDNSTYGKIVVGTVSGTSITFGTSVQVDVAGSYELSVAFDPNDSGKFVIVYKGAYPDRGRAVVGTISGTSATLGTTTIFGSGISPSWTEVAFDPNTAGKFVLIYSTSGSGIAIVGTVSGTSITYGTPVEYDATSQDGRISFDPNTAGKFVIASHYYSVDFYVGTISGTSITFGTPISIPNSRTHISLAFDPNALGKFVFLSSVASTYYGTAVVCQLEAAGLGTTNLTSTNFLGTSTATYTNAQTATIMLQGGVSDNQTGLTVGSTYYVQPDGTFATTAGTPSVEAGKALSVTSLLLSDPAVSASDLASGTLPDTVFPATLPAISGANLTNLPAAASDFTSITEGSNTGYGTSERSANPNNYGDIGNLAIDLSYSHGSSTTRGATGEYSTALGRNTIASGLNSFTTGFSNTASGNYSIAMGGNSEASGNKAFVFGDYSYASGGASFAVGTEVEASGENSVALGSYTIAKGNNSVALNYDTTAAGIYSTAMGKFGGVGTAGTTLLGVAFGASDPGNIKSTTTDTNLVFKVSTAGDGYFDGVADSAAADYAEYFESSDGSELERGYFVSFAQGSECVEYGNSELVGIVSAAPAVVGDSQSLHYKGKYQKDEFGAYIREPVKLYDDDGVYTHTEIHKILSIDFDPTQEYLPRSDRPEWSPIGLLGKLWVHIATGETIATGDYVTSDIGGKAIKCLRTDSDSFRVMDINSDHNLVKVLYK